MSWRIWRIAIFHVRGVVHEEEVWGTWPEAMAAAKAWVDEYKLGSDEGTWRIDLINDLDDVSRSWGKLPRVRSRLSGTAQP